MSLLARAECALGRHSGQWSPPDGRCISYRICECCGRTEARTEHVWGRFSYTGP
jgi:hypothetical protein